MKRIGVIADTHITDPRRSLPSFVLESLRGVDLIIHAGDLCHDCIIRPLLDIAPLHAVSGNCDPDHLAAQLDARLVVEVERARIGVTHGHRGRGSTTPRRALNVFAEDDVQCVVFGHSHVPLCEEIGGVMLFNPGSCTEPRGQPLASLGFLIVEGDQVRGELRYR